jgi:transposase
MPYANSPDKSSFACPNCGAEVPPKALACPECGADETAGWNEAGYAGGGSADPEDEFDYAEAFDKEFGSSAKPEGVKPLWWITGVAVIILFLFAALRAVI